MSTAGWKTAGLNVDLVKLMIEQMKEDVEGTLLNQGKEIKQDGGPIGQRRPAHFTGNLLTELYRLTGKGLCFDLVYQVDHFDGAQGAVVTFVAGLCSGSFDGLFDVVCGQDAEHDGNVSGQRNGGDAL